MKLHPYQERAVSHLRKHPGCALFLDMGLGKTAITLSALEPRHLPALVIAPKRVAEHVWPHESAIWRPDLRLSVAAGSPASRRSALASSADIVALGRDNLKDAPLGRFRTIVLDELSSFKSHASARFKLARKLVRTADHVWGLTGTPSPNKYLDLWSQVFLLDGGKRLGTSITGFRSRYFYPGYVLPNHVVTSWELRPGADQRINSLLSDICLSMSAEEYLQLPPAVVNRVEVDIPMGPYRELRNKLVLDMRDTLGPSAIHTAASAMVLSGKLSQVTAGFIYSDTFGGAASHLHTAKIDAVKEIVEGTGGPVLVFYRFQEELAQLRKALPKAEGIDDAPDTINRWNERKVPVLLAHPASAGHGLNLQRGGSTIVFTTLPWSLEEYQQSCGRLARQGQKERVVIHHIIAPGTVDEYVSKALEDKGSVQKVLLDYLADPVGVA